MTQAYDNMVFNLLLHIGKIFEFVVIKLKILNGELMKLSELEPQQNEQQIIKQLNDIVDLHNEATDFVEQCDSIISPIVLATYTIKHIYVWLTFFHTDRKMINKNGILITLHECQSLIISY